MAKKIRLGVAGCGYWGPNLIRNFRALPDCQLKMMCDLKISRLSHLRTIYPEIEAATDYAHMLNGVNLDAVVIATAWPTIIPWRRRHCLPASILSSKSPWQV